MHILTPKNAHLIRTTVVYRGCPIIRRFYYKKIRPVWQKSFRRFRAGRHFGGQAPASTFFATNKGKKIRTPCLKLYYFTQLFHV